MTQYPFIGIDIGKTSIHVAHPERGKPPREWPVIVFNYDEHRDWHHQLTAMIAPSAIVSLEPTGYHLSAPVINVIQRLKPDARLFIVGHSVAGQVRSAHISAAKTDEMDARALCLVSQMVEEGKPPRNVREHRPLLDASVQSLRALVNNRQRLVKTTTRLTNRLHAFAHAIHPLLDIKFTTWLRLAGEGIIDPAEIHQYARDNAHIDKRRLRPILALTADLPDIPAAPAAYAEVQRTLEQLRQADDQRAHIEADIKHAISNPPFRTVSQRLMTIPAASEHLIAPIHVACHGLLEELTPDEVKACIGIAARSNTSGATDRTKAQKGGYKHAQTALFLWAMALLSPINPDTPIRHYHHRLKARGKPKTFRATRAKLAMLISGVARSEDGYHD